MQTPQLIENFQDFQCQQHGQSAMQIIIDQNISNDKRLICKECQSSSKFKSIQLIQAIQLSDDQVNRKLQNYQSLSSPFYQLLTQFQSSILQLKQHLISILNELEKITIDWLSNIQANGYQMAKYSIYDELNQLVENLKQIPNKNEEQIRHDFQKNNIQWIQKLNSSTKQLQNYNLKFRDSLQMIKDIFKKNLECSQTTGVKFQISQQLQELLIGDEIQGLSADKELSNSIEYQRQEILTKNTQQFQYQLVTQPYKQQDECNAIAINYNNSLFVAALNNAPKFSIKVIQMIYPNEQSNKFQINLKELQTLEGNHKDYVTTLNFFKSKHMRDSFISGSSDATIIIWSATLSKQQIWNPSIKLVGHSSLVLCLVVSNQEDLIISGSSDNSIKFWSSSSIKIWSCLLTIEEHSDQVYGLSLDDTGSKLISCGNDNLILVIQICDKRWKIKQKIYTQNVGFRLCFLTSQLFAFQSASQGYLQFFQSNNNNELFEKKFDIQINGAGECCDCFFPSIYNSSKGIVVFKNGQHINILQCIFTSSHQKKLQNIQECYLIQAIQFETQMHLQGKIYGTLSDDGNLLVTWDVKSKEFQIRQYIKIE